LRNGVVETLLETEKRIGELIENNNNDI